MVATGGRGGRWLITATGRRPYHTAKGLPPSGDHQSSAKQEPSQALEEEDSKSHHTEPDVEAQKEECEEAEINETQGEASSTPAGSGSKQQEEGSFWDSDPEQHLPTNPDGTPAEIERFHPDLYQFMAPRLPWGRQTERGPDTQQALDKAEETPVQPAWQEFQDEPESCDDWQSLVELEEEAVKTSDDLELMKAMRLINSSRGKAYGSWRAYVESLAKPDADTQPLNPTIHMLGLGSAGKYIAHCIAALPHAPPVTLLMHRPLMMQHWHDEGAAIHVIKGNKIHTQTNFHIESSAEFSRQDPYQQFPGFGPNLEHTAEPPNYPIDTVIVTTQTYKTVSALNSIKHRLRHTSTILFVNDGLGLAELVNEKVFPDPYFRPTYILGNMTHALESTERNFTLIEKNPGKLECSKLPQQFVSKVGRSSAQLRKYDYSWTAGASHLVGTLARTPELSTSTLGHKSFYVSQLQTLVAGAVIGPLSVVFDATNDYLLYNYNASLAMKSLLQEISRLVCSLPELQSLPQIHDAFSPKKLEAVIVSKINKSGKNFSAMLKATRAGDRTDIMFYNGYLDRRSKQLGIDMPRNEMLLQLVRGKGAAQSRAMNNYIPFEDD
ncbi:2-dehydropantoate 2-reductase [Diplocarpon rosae]|nr:2-dehydropantoate 2-reductase [Diplocarpon rosae]